MSAIDQRIVLEALKLLISTGKQSNSSDNADGAPKDFLNGILKRNLIHFKDVLDADIRFEALKNHWKQENFSIVDEASVRWRFTETCLELLFMLQMSIKEATAEFNKSVKDKPDRDLTPNQAPALSPDSLSVEQQKTVSTVLQFIVCLGISPCLQAGVGVPVDVRTGFGHLFKCSEKNCPIDETEKRYRLLFCAKILFECCQISCLSSLILFKHLGDVLSLLLQICFGYQKQKQNLSSSHSETEEVQTTNKTQCLASPNSRSLDVSNSNSSLELKGQVGLETAPRTSDLVEGTQKIKSSLSYSSQQTNFNSPDKSTDSSKFSVPKLQKKDMEIRHEDYMHCEKFLKSVLKRVYQPLLVRELMLLQGRGVSAKLKGQAVKDLSGTTPVWLRAICGKLLSEILMKPKGVLNVLNGMMEGSLASKTDSLTSMEWKKCDAIAQIISQCPMKSSSAEQYYKHISPQILELINLKDEMMSQYYLRVACSTVTNMFLKHECLAKKYLIEPLLKPLNQLTCRDLMSGETVCTESELTNCIECAHKVFLSGLEPDSAVLKTLYPLIHILFSLYCFVYEGVFHIKKQCRELLVHCFKQFPASTTIEALNFCILGTFNADMKLEHHIEKMEKTVIFAAGDNGGVKAVTIEDSHSDETRAEYQEKKVHCIIDILTDLQECGIAGEFFIDMLKKLTAIIRSQIGQLPSTKLPSSDTATPLLDFELKQQAEANAFIEQLTILNILSAVCEVLGPACLKSTNHVLDFVKVTLERGIEICMNTEDEGFSVFESETILMALGLLTALMTGALQVKEEDKEKMKTLSPLLEELSIKHPDTSVQEMANNLRIAVATHGASWTDDITKMATEYINKMQKRTSKDNDHKKKKEKPVIEVLSTVENCIPDGRNTQVSLQTKVQKQNEVTEGNQEKDTGSSNSVKSKVLVSHHKMENAFQQAIVEVKDPLLPVRGHGIISLTNLIKNKDPDAMKNQEMVVEIFLHNLSDEDSYLYLSAVNGLVALADKFPNVVIERLTKEYAEYGENPRSSEERVKLGECILKASKNLGDVIPMYRDVLLNSLLSGTKDADSLVRASSLSNLGEVCKLLRFSIGNNVQEIFNCCSSLLKTDNDVEVRKAAVLMLTLLLQGLGKDVIKVLDTLIRDLYRLLKLTWKTEREDGVKLHINIALNELDSIMKEYIFPQQKLEKRITVLDPP